MSLHEFRVELKKRQSKVSGHKYEFVEMSAYCHILFRIAR